MTLFIPFTVQVPATTANLGPAFDCLGLALDVWNRVDVAPAREPMVEVEGEGAERLARSARNLTYRAALLLFERLGRPMPALRLSCFNAIPLTRGLGSSAAAVVAGLMAANHVAGRPFTGEELLALATEMEGHPDNAAPALFGGCQLVVRHGEAIITRSVPLAPGLTCVLFLPEAVLSTRAARSVLPRRVPRGDAVFNIGRTVLLTQALTTGRWEDLRLATQDRLHQPYRASLFPAMEGLFDAALKAGAAGAFLSGAGPAILALAPEPVAMAIAAALEEGARLMGVSGKVRIVSPVAQGARLIEGTGS